MDTTIILVLILSAFFLGSILWLVIYSRRQQRVAAQAKRPAAPAGKNVRRMRTPGSGESG
jgi:preprotein translocase subunit SecG